MKNKVLLHACCAVCAAYPLEILFDIGFFPVVYFFNPNIYPNEEYERRLEELVCYCEKKKINLIIDEQDSSNWYKYIEGLEEEPEKGKRCSKCFEYRLLYTARKAIELEIPKFTTTLSVSPHKNSKEIFRIGKEIAYKYELEFLEIDFKKHDGFLKSMQIAKTENFYRQNYCGCKFSNRR